MVVFAPLSTKMFKFISQTFLKNVTAKFYTYMYEPTLRYGENII